MIVTIDNLNGGGAIDYSAALSADAPLKIERTLNAPSRCLGSLVLEAGNGALPQPVRRARIVVSSDSGTVLFTGYFATEPAPMYAGAGLAGPVYRYEFTAISDEWLLDKQAAVLTGDGFAVPGGDLLNSFTERTAAGLLNPSSAAHSNPIGVFTPEPTQPWSSNASAIAGSTYAAYRALAGALDLQPIGTVTHALNFDSEDGVGTLQPAALTTSMVKELANDVTLTGQIEPSEYVTEMFSGDGTTAIFTLANQPFQAARPELLVETFTQPTISPRTWKVADPASHISLGGGGLTLTGGTGYDGQTTLTALDQIELGGSLLVEAANVQIAAPSDGVLCGLYSGPVQRANCFAGYNVRQSGGAILLTPFVNGAEVGTPFSIVPGHRYTLRIRLHSPEMQRALQTYYARVDGVLQSFGGGMVPSPVSLVFDLIDLGNASNTLATILYGGMVSTAPAYCTFGAVNSLQLNGSFGAFSVTQTGSTWITSTSSGGESQTRLLGIAGEGVDCQMTTAGVVTFFAGRVPLPGEIVTILYRTHTRAVARLQGDASIAAEAAGGMPGTARWLGKVVRPQARCSADAEAAAQAVLALATSRSAALSGTYTAINPAADIWPGDVLAITANGQTHTVVVRQVALTDGHAVPEVLNYRVGFANDWAEALAITLSEATAVDVCLPATAASAPAQVQVLANLQQLTVTSATATMLEIDAGIDPPLGGGFEVRLRDWDFSPGADQNLVLRSTVRSFSIPRTAQVERYLIRMFDGATPRLYSRLSAALYTHLPVA